MGSAKQTEFTGELVEAYVSLQFCQASPESFQTEPAGAGRPAPATHPDDCLKLVFYRPLGRPLGRGTAKNGPNLTIWNGRVAPDHHQVHMCSNVQTELRTCGLC